jgi:hypothetical protein
MRVPYGKILLEDGKTEVLIEIGDTGSYQGKMGVIDGLKEKFGEIMGIVEQTAKSAHSGYMNIPPEIRPKELELSFGIKLNSEAGLVFSKIGGEGSFQVTLRWAE